MSGYANDAIAHRGVLEPGLEVLTKPFTPSVLLAKVRAVLDLRTKRFLHVRSSTSGSCDAATGTCTV